ncbi:restriction endonuclease [Sphingopyxis indica]|uniref:restriction endonuclease n=1 Tax=Sphingopyxis indica TaxID=436663 RepID=UPI002938E654|nr:restriction endonuclease [Sphingopyxis indica]WOF43285.1 restriction endonuclease [Sphingopyxis indica]
MTAVSATNVYYIKLGRGGDWEAECIRDGILRFGYREAPHDLCAAGDWSGVWEVMMGVRGDPGAATRDVKQIRAFYESDESTIFITFVGGLLYWCRPSGEIELLADKSHRRGTVDGWHNSTTGGSLLTADRLSGHLLKVQMFRGTICDVAAADYLLRKLSDELSPEVAAAEEAERLLMAATIPLMRLLTWQDFELLVDLIFSSSGWRRVTQVGRTQKTVDLELILPSTAERAFVQVKSQASRAALEDYRERLADAEAYDRMFFVWHSGNISEDLDANGVILLGPTRLARMIVDSGLTSWLREKVS